MWQTPPIWYLCQIKRTAKLFLQMLYHFYTMWRHANKTVLFECKLSPVLWVTVPEALCKGIAGYLQLCDLKSRAQHEINLSAANCSHTKQHFILNNHCIAFLSERTAVTGWCHGLKELAGKPVPFFLITFEHTAVFYQICNSPRSVFQGYIIMSIQCYLKHKVNSY